MTKEMSEIKAVVNFTVDGELFEVGDKVRVIMKSKKNPKFSYCGNSYIGTIESIFPNYFILNREYWMGDALRYEDISHIRKAKEDESFNTVPYYNDEEKEFWTTHCYSKDGICKKKGA